MGQYADLLRKKGVSNVNMAVSRGADLKKTQSNKCAKCKKELRSGYYKTVTDPRTKVTQIVCSDCLVAIAKRY